MKNVNFNSVLIMIVIAICGWALKENINNGRDMAEIKQKILATSESVQDLRQRQAISENQIVLMRIDIERMKREQANSR